MWIKNNSNFEDHTLLCLYLSASLSLAGTGATKMSRGRSRWCSRRGKRLLLIWHLYQNYKWCSRRKSVWVHPIFTRSLLFVLHPLFIVLPTDIQGVLLTYAMHSKITLVHRQEKSSGNIIMCEEHPLNHFETLILQQTLYC